MRDNQRAGGGRARSGRRKRRISRRPCCARQACTILLLRFRLPRASQNQVEHRPFLTRRYYVTVLRVVCAYRRRPTKHVFAPDRFSFSIETTVGTSRNGYALSWTADGKSNVYSRPVFPPVRNFRRNFFYLTAGRKSVHAQSRPGEC